MKRPSKSADALARIAALTYVDTCTWKELKQELAPISDSYLRSVLRHSGKPLAPVVEGVRTASTTDASRTLLALAEEYDRGDPAIRRECRALVLQAKQRLRVKMRSESTSEASEILLWVSTWLENPSLFPIWLRLRERH